MPDESRQFARTALSPATRVPEPEEGSGQYFGETWEQFFERKLTKFNNPVKAETPAAREKRLGREAEA